MKKAAWILSVAMVWTYSLASVVAEDRPIVAVFDVEVRGPKMSKEVLDRLTDYLGSLMAERGYQVVPRSQLRDRLRQEKKGSYQQCYDQSCQIEIGKEMAAQKSLATQVLKIGSKCKVTVTLFDLQRAASQGAGTASGSCGEDGVVDSLEKAVATLLGGGSQAVPVKPAPVAVDSPGPKSPDLSEHERLATVAAAERTKDVKQPGSNLYWLRCPSGQTWTGSDCQGERSKMKWDAAMKACPAGYRLPTRQEFVELLGGCDGAVSGVQTGACASCEKSAGCSAMFGEALGFYWSSSSYAALPSFAWLVAFGSGNVVNVDKRNDYDVRCVRSGP